MSRKSDFLKAYQELCEKYRLRLVSDDFYGIGIEEIDSEGDKEWLHHQVEILQEKFPVGEEEE